MSRDAQALSSEEIEKEVERLPKEWEVLAGRKLWLEVELEDFAEVMKAVNAIAKAAEELNHHPNLYIHSYNQLAIELMTHSIQGLSDFDFKLARKIEDILS